MAGLIVSLAVITLLRAADRAQTRWPCAGPCAGRGPATCWSWLVTAPLALARALLTEALIAPLAFAAGAAVYGATSAHAQQRMPQAGRVRGRGRRGLVRPRPRLRQAAAAAEPDGRRRWRAPAERAVIALAVWALAVGAVMFAVSQGPRTTGR